MDKLQILEFGGYCRNVLRLLITKQNLQGIGISNAMRYRPKKEAARVAVVRPWKKSGLCLRCFYHPDGCILQQNLLSVNGKNARIYGINLISHTHKNLSGREQQ